MMISSIQNYTVVFKTKIPVIDSVMLNSFCCPASYTGGKGYHLGKHILTAVPKPENDHEARFNEAHAKIHNVLRTTLGLMKRRFRCLMQLGFAEEASLNKKSNIIKACSVLHNIAQKFSVPPPPSVGRVESLYPGKQHSAATETNLEAVKARQELIEKHFSAVSSNQEPIDSDVSKEDM